MRSEIKRLMLGKTTCSSCKKRLNTELKNRNTDQKYVDWFWIPYADLQSRLGMCACQVQETKAELIDLGDRIEEVRSICKQLQTQLRHIPECNLVSFEGVADTLMDRWLDVSSFHLWPSFVHPSCCCYK